MAAEYIAAPFTMGYLTTRWYSEQVGFEAFGEDGEPLDHDSAAAAVTADGRLPTGWLLRKLQGQRSWALNKRTDATQVGAASGSARMVGASPQWVVLDGPLGTPAAEAVASLLAAPSLVMPSGGAVAALGDAAHYVWETGSLAAASPGLLAAVPVVHVGEGMWDAEAAILAGVRLVVRQQGMVRLLHITYI